jgi:hypothetical protein
MPFRIAGFPRGLLSLLDAQNFGTNPSQVSETIVPTVDVAPFLASSVMRLVNCPAAAALVGGFNACPLGVVPPGETWLVIRVSAQVTAGVGEAVAAFAPAILWDAGTLQLTDPQAVAASQTRWAAAPQSAPFALNSGAAIGVYTSGITGVPTGQVTVVYARLRT